MLLENKNAVIYGGGGAIGSAVARAFAREGARVFHAGRTREPLEEVVEEIRCAGGMAETAVLDALDALDERAVDKHADAIAASAGSIDVSFKLISHGDVQGTPLAEMSLEDFERPIRTAFIRVVTLQSGGVPEAIPDDFYGRDAIVEMIVGATMLGRAATFEDVGNVAAFAASDLARTITGTNINITSGAVAD
jgi:NAD(P)-dependent dehydrogenase (short-subunit alcohol dehydrogenase family)